MKKVFFLFAFLFTVVCFAAPPPDQSSDFNIEEIGEFRSQGDITLPTLKVQEVAFAYLGNELERPRAANNKFSLNKDFVNRLHAWKANKQNTNFGYTFGADY